MALDNAQFELDYAHFTNAVKDFDKKLCNIISKGFQFASNAAAAFRLLESFDSQMRRDAIRKEIEEKYSKLLVMYSKDLTLVYHIFHDNLNNPPVMNNLPRVAGALQWVTGLIERVQWPMEKLEKVFRINHANTC